MIAGNTKIQDIGIKIPVFMTRNLTLGAEHVRIATKGLTHHTAAAV